MKKNFLLLLWLTLLPFTAWAANYDVTVTCHPTTKVYGAANGTLAVGSSGNWTVSFTRPSGMGTQSITGNTANQLLALLALADNYQSTPVAGTHTWNVQLANPSIYQVTSGGDNYRLSSTRMNSATLTVTRANNAITGLALEGWTYSGTPNTPTYTSTLEGTPDSYLYFTNALETTGGTTTPPTNAGTYYVRAHIAQQPNHNELLSAPVEFKINKANVEVKLYQVVREWRNPWSKIISEDIDLPALETSAYKVEGADATWAKIVGAMSWNQLQEPENVGSYKYTLNVDETNDALKNYIVNVNAEGAGLKLEKNTTGDWTTVAVSADPLTYNGEEQTLAPKVVPEFKDTDGNVAGTIEYTLTPADDSSWSTEFPKATDAKTSYVVSYRGVGDVNHTDAPSVKTYSVKIDKASTPLPKVTAVAGTFTYPGTVKEAEFTVDTKSDGAKSYTYEFKAPDATSFTAKAFDGSAGTWRVYAKQAESTNWYALTGTEYFEFTVAKADNEFTTKPVKAADWQYNAVAHNLLSNLGAVKGGATKHYRVHYTPNEGSSSPDKEYDDAMPTATAAGTYTIYYSAAATNNYKKIDEVELGTVTVSKATLTVTGVAAQEGVIYNAEKQMLLKSGATVETSYGVALSPSSPKEFSIEYYWPSNSVSGWKSVLGKDAGTYEINYQVTPTDLNNFAIPAAGKVTAKIGKRGLDVGAQPLTVNWTGTPVEAKQLISVDPKDIPSAEDPDVKAGLGEALAGFKAGEFKLNKDGNYTVVDPIPSDAGAYVFVLETKVNKNYEINNFTPNGTLTIVAIPAVPATVAAADLTYTGADQALVTVSGTPVGGTMLYYLETEKTGAGPIDAGDARWSTTIPEAKKADDYKVWTMIQGDKNHKDVVAAKAIDVKIKQKALALSMFKFSDDDMKAVYTGENLMPTFTFADGTPSALVQEDFTVAKTNSAAKEVTEMVNVDVYTFTFKAAATGNYQGEVKANFEITKAGNEIKDLAVADWTYGDDPNAPTYTAKFKGEGEPKFTYAVKGLTEFSDKVPVNAGEYTVKANIAATANWAAAEATANFKIEKAPLTLKASDGTKVYEEADPDWSKWTLAEAPVYKNGDNAEKIGLTFSRQAGEDVGEYKISPKATSTNYTYTYVDGKFTITKQAVTPTAPTANVLTYNGQNQALIKAGSAKGSTIQYALGDGEYGDAIPEAKNAGTYTVKYQFTPGKNFSIDDKLASGEFEVKILQANVKFRMGKQEETYTGEAFEPKEGKAYTLADGGFFAGDEDVLTFAFEEGFDATTACEEGRPFTKLVYTFKDDIANYTVDFQNEGLLIIKKANPADFEAPAAIDLTYDGLAHALVTTGSVAKVDDKPLGTIMFSDKEDGTYTADVPQGTDAKEYNVYFKVVGDENHKDTNPAKVENVKIKPFALFADMIKAETLSKPYTAAVQSFPMSLKVKLAADKKDPRTLVEKQDYTVKINGKEVKDVEIKNAGDYVYTFTGKGNYTGEISTTAKITKLELIATAPNAVKTYDATNEIEPEEFDCTATELKLYGGLQISGLLADDKIDLGGKTISDIIEVPANAVNVGTYSNQLKVKVAAIPEQANYTITETLPGTLTVNKAAAVKIGFYTWEETDDEFWGTTVVKTKEYSKSYGTADNLTVIPGDLMALEGEFFETPEYVAEILGISREAGEVYKKDGYTVSLGWSTSTNAAIKAKVAQFQKNYEGVTFGTTKFFITPFAGTIKVSIKSMAVTFDGNDRAAEVKWADDLSNMVVTGAPRDKKEIFTELPKITVTPKDGKVRNAGDYNITLSGGKSDNYDLKKVQFVLGSYLTVEPYEITPDMVTIPDQQVKLGDKAKDVIDHTAFTFVEPLPVAEDANLFQVVAAPDFIDGNGKIKLGENPAEGLILARKDNTNAEALNYTGYDEVFGYLSIIGTPDLLVLDDTKDIATKDRENTDVTFTNRSIRQDDWNVLCLPFDATIKEISDAFGYAAVDLLKRESVDGSMHFVVTTSGTVPAGEPFIIKPTSDPELNAKSNFVQVKFSGVTVKEFSDNPEPVKDSAGNKFCGTFKAQTTFFGEKFWYMSKSEWKQASNFTEANPVKLGAYRAYIETATAGARIFIEEPDGTITAINAIDLNNNTMDEGWYTVNGMKLNAAPTQKGTYIKDGKKVFVK